MGNRIHAFTNDALGHYDAVGLAEQIAAKKVSVAEVTEAAIARAEKLNPELNAIEVKTYELARQTERLASHGVFHGIPAFIKDNDHLGGYPTQLGTGAFVAKKAQKNSKFVNQFLSAGCSVLGKSTMPEFGLICSTENPKWGITRNPWNTDYTTGGSSSGSAALVASGVVPIATANDGAGSIRIPAGCCGLVGLKPSRGRLHAMEGTELMPLQIVYQGVLTRSVRDTAEFYRAAEHFYRNPRLPEIGHVKHASKKRLKIAFFHNPPVGKAGHQDEDTYRVQLETAKLLQSLGHEVEQIAIPINIDEMTDHYLNYYGFLAYMLSHWGRVTLQSVVKKSELEPFTLGLSQKFKANASKTPGSIRMLKRTGAETDLLFQQYDVVMNPVVAHITPKIGHFSVELPYEEIADRAVSYASYAGLQNITGAPAISLPLGIDRNDMPLGVQFSAAFGQDRLLIELAYELEEAKPWRQMFGG